MKKLVITATIILSLLPTLVFAQSSGNCINGRTDTGAACFTGTITPANSTGDAASNNTGQSNSSVGGSGSSQSTVLQTAQTYTQTAPAASATSANNPQTVTTPDSAFSAGGGVTGVASTNQVSTANGGVGTTNTGCPAGGYYNQTNGTCDLGYTPLEPIPGLTTGTNLTNGSGLASLINAAFKILITIGALLAVLNLTIGGIQYMTSSSIGTKTNGINRARNSMWGIVLIAGIWLILNTVNPQLLNFNLNPCPSTASGVGGCATGTNSNGITPISGTSASTPSTNGTGINSDVGYSGTVTDVVNNLNNDTPNPAECAAAEVGTGVKSANDPGIIANLGSSLQRGANQAYYIAKAAFWDTPINYNGTPLTDMYNAGSTAYNQISTAETAFVARCQSAGY